MPAKSDENVSLGMVFGFLTVLSVQRKERSRLVAECSCVCGGRATPSISALKSGNTRSCGCLWLATVRTKAITHGQRQTNVWHVWQQLKQRCLNPKNKQYKDYGGRGIGVCPEWRCFQGFIADMGVPAEEQSLDRVDNDKGYYKGNCRWATRKQQANNKRTNHYLTFRGKTMTMMQWSDELGIPYTMLRDRINGSKWEVEKP